MTCEICKNGCFAGMCTCKCHKKLMTKECCKLCKGSVLCTKVYKCPCHQQPTNSQQEWREEFEEWVDVTGVWSKHASVHFEAMSFIESLLKQVIEESPQTPENWDKWSIERQLGYNQCWINMKKQKTTKFLGGHNDR